MTTLEELESQKKRLLAKKDFESFVSKRASEKKKLRSEIFALKHPNIKNLPRNVKVRVGIARERVQRVGKGIKRFGEGVKKLDKKIKSFDKKTRKSDFQGINFKSITG